MASKTASKALRSSLARQVVGTSQRRTFASALHAASRPAVAAAVNKTAIAAPMKQQSRGMKTIDFAGHKEVVYERADWPRDKLLVRFPRPSSGEAPLPWARALTIHVCSGLLQE